MRAWTDVLKRILPVLLLLLFIAAALFRGPSENAADGASESGSDSPLTADAFLLDTFCTLTVYEGSEEALKRAEELLARFDDLLNQSKETSDIYRINHRAEDSVSVDPLTAELLRWAKQYEAETDGDFDITVAPLSELWDVQHRTEVPTEEEIEAAREKLRFGDWEIEENVFTAHDLVLQIDVGAFAKGFIADCLKAQLEADGVTSAVINLGGNVLCIGKEREDLPFRIGLKKPERGSSEYLRVLAIDDLSVVTAGIYERFFEADGVVYHHILDPKTGWPVQSGLAAVTVVGERSVACDALCTTLFVKGEEAGRAFLERYNEAHAAESETPYCAFFIYRDGSMSYTEGAEALFFD